MESELSQMGERAREAIARAQTLDELEKIRVAYVGRNGALTAILRSIKDLTEKDKARRGAETNALRREIEALLAARVEELKKTFRESAAKTEWIDTSRPGIRRLRGHLHPITKILREIIPLFSSMGFSVVEGPEIETEYYNFDALNIPANHPARDMWDTFWLRQESSRRSEMTGRGRTAQKQSSRLLLRTHTSPVQVRYMEQHQPPLRIIIPGRVYRYEATDASHDIQFHQVEGLLVDRTISIGNFKAIIGAFFAGLFSPKTKTRLRPSYFPFTAPSFEIDISCIACGAKGCAVCKRTGWLEIAGAGMVHRNVFRAVGYNPRDVSGFAFGMGLTRLAMMKYKIPDIRLFHAGDIRFLRQF